MLNDAGFKLVLVDGVHNFSCATIERIFAWVKQQLNNKFYKNEIVIFTC
jgi:hypothetical protein